MISDDKRRDVAKKLRETCDEIERTGNGLTVWELTDILAIRDDDSWMIESLNLDDARNLADLIDRPTCRNNGNRDDRYFWCSRCGYEAWTYDDSGCDPSDFSFCPDCGAVVVDEV